MLTLVLAEALNPDTVINRENHINLIGINGEDNKLQSLGSTFANLTINNVIIRHKFQVVDQKINLTSDGLLGMDFLLKYHAHIDFEDNKLILQVPMNHEVYDLEPIPLKYIENINCHGWLLLRSRKTITPVVFVKIIWFTNGDSLYKLIIIIVKVVVQYMNLKFCEFFIVFILNLVIIS